MRQVFHFPNSFWFKRVTEIMNVQDYIRQSSSSVGEVFRTTKYIAYGIRQAIDNIIDVFQKLGEHGLRMVWTIGESDEHFLLFRVDDTQTLFSIIRNILRVFPDHEPGYIHTFDNINKLKICLIYWQHNHTKKILSCSSDKIIQECIRDQQMIWQRYTEGQKYGTIYYRRLDTAKLCRNTKIFSDYLTTTDFDAFFT